VVVVLVVVVVVVVGVVVVLAGVVGVVVVDVLLAGVVDVVVFGTILIQAEVNGINEINNTITKSRERPRRFLHMVYLLIPSTLIIYLTFSRNPHEP
jgi:uncharacterized membrane protein HdeD (DUF308 family)